MAATFQSSASASGSGWTPSNSWSPTPAPALASTPVPPGPWSAYLGNATEENDADADAGDGGDLDGGDFPGTIGHDDDVIQQYLCQNYVFHKKRWRMFAGRPTRYQRFGKGQGKGSL
eukprot:385118-Pyramimonas_sp.AAC.1